MAQSPAASPPSASNSQHSATHALTPPNPQVDGGMSNGVTEKKPDVTVDSLEEFDSEEDIQRYRKYEANFSQRLMAKYFSNKNLYGGNIFDEKVTIDDETIKLSRWPCTQSFADPVQGFAELNGNGSPSAAETPTDISNGKYSSKKSD